MWGRAPPLAARAFAPLLTDPGLPGDDADGDVDADVAGDRSNRSPANRLFSPLTPNTLVASRCTCTSTGKSAAPSENARVQDAVLLPTPENEVK